MKEQSSLKKEFSKRDVQRMRNLITGKSGGKTIKEKPSKPAHNHIED